MEATWQWYNYILSNVPAGRIPLRINLGETAISLYQGGREGNVFVLPRAPPVEHVSLGTRRKYVTHIAVICDAPHIQPLQEQVLVCNERTIPLKVYAALRASMPANVRLVRQKSAWNNIELFVETIRRLGAILAPFAATYTPIYSFDTAKIHIASRVFNACRRAGMLPHLVAAKMTWALQPFDIRAIRPYRVQIQKEYQRCKLRAANSDVGIKEWLACVCAAIRVVLQRRCWAAAFDSAGLSLNQINVSDDIKVQLGIATLLAISQAQPSTEQLRQCFPQKAKVPTNAVWQACELLIKAPVAPRSMVAKPKALSPLPCVAVGIPLGRLRPPPPAPLTRRSARIAAKAKPMHVAGAAPSGSAAKSGCMRPPFR